MLEDRMYDAINKLKIAVPGTSCILISPDLVSRFVESVGSISILKKPSNAYSVEITTVEVSTPAVPKTQFV